MLCILGADLDALLEWKVGNHAMAGIGLWGKPHGPLELAGCVVT